MNFKMITAMAVIVVAAGAAWNLFNSPGRAAGEAGAIVIPVYSQVAQSGQVAFEGKCADCHGLNGAGTDKGPTFLHAFYKPDHHGDASFEIAAKRGVRAHHWRFGDMPPVEGITDAEIRWITKYVRELQAANGY